MADTPDKVIAPHLFLLCNKYRYPQNAERWPDAPLPQVIGPQAYKHRAMHFWRGQRWQAWGQLCGHSPNMRLYFCIWKRHPTWGPPIQGGKMNRTQEGYTGKAYDRILTQSRSMKISRHGLSDKETAGEVEGQHVRWENSHLVFSSTCRQIECSPPDNLLWPINFSTFLDFYKDSVSNVITAIWI